MVSPGNAYVRDDLFRLQLNHYPLRMEAVIFACERLCEIGIALPVGVEIAIIKSGIAIELRTVIAGNSAVRQIVTVRVANQLT